MACDESMVNHVLVCERAPYKGTASALLNPQFWHQAHVRQRHHLQVSWIARTEVVENRGSAGVTARRRYESGCHFLRVVRGCRAQRGPRSTDSRFLRDRKNGNIRVQQSLSGITFASDYKSLCIIDRDRLHTIFIKK